MAQELGSRYRTLFQVYGIGGHPQLLQLKQQIASKETILREDAMYFLLISFDHMVMRALSGYIPDISSTDLDKHMNGFVSYASVDDMINRVLNEIYSDLFEHRASDEKFSANDIIRAVNNKNKIIGEIMQWWHE